MSALNHVVQLDDLLSELFWELELLVFEHLDGTLLKLLVARGRQLNIWEQVLDNAIKQRDIVRQELRQIDIHDAFED